MLSIEPGRWHQSQEKLASICIRSYTDKIKSNELQVQIQISVELCLPELAMDKNPPEPCLMLKFSSLKEEPNLLMEPKPFPETTSPPNNTNNKNID